MSREKTANEIARPGGHREVTAAIGKLIDQRKHKDVVYYTICPYHFYVSQQRRDDSITHKGKHGVAKIFDASYDSKYYSDALKKDIYQYQRFIDQGMTDSYLCHIMHAGNDMAPKGKFVPHKEGKITYVSRLYSLDHQGLSHQDAMKNGAAVDVRKKDLYHWFKKNYQSFAMKMNPPETQGLLEAIVFNVVFHNWDHKMENMTAYEMKGTSGKPSLFIAAFDMTYSLQQDADYQKRWSYEEFASLVRGTDVTTGKPVGVATALMETFGELGTRTSDYYRKDMARADRKAWAEVCDGSRDMMVKMIARELEKVHPVDPQAALLTVFEQVLEKITNHQATARNKVDNNFLKVVSSGLKANNKDCDYHYKRLSGLHQKTMAARKEFAGFTQRFRDEQQKMTQEAPGTLIEVVKHGNRTIRFWR